jgi:hypothetical protein
MLAQQGEPWATLYGWLSERVVSDFDCGLPGMSYSDSYFSTPDELYRAWLTFENLGRGIAKIDGVRIDPSHYVLSSIEQGGGVYMDLYALTEPACMAWLTVWDYPGNPYHGSVEVANRALVVSIVDAMMSYEDDGGSQEKASSFQAHAYVYQQCGHLLPPAVKDAYKEYLRLTFERFAAWVSTGTQADLDSPSLAAMFITGGILGSDYPARAEAHCDAFLNKHYKDAGYIDHGGGFDPSYNGWSIKYLLWAYYVSGYEPIRAALQQMARLKVHMTLLDAGKWIGPSSFSTNTAFGSATDQAWTVGRDVMLSSATNDAIPLRYTGRSIAGWRKPYGVASEAQMRADLQSWTSRANNQEASTAYGTWTRPKDYAMPAWRQERHMELPNLAWELYPESGTFYDEVVIEEGALLPFDRPGDFIEQFGDKFVIWKLGGFGGIIHTGRLSWWNKQWNEPQVAGFSGGSLCALWTTETGVALLGRQRGYANKTDPDTLDTMPTWAVQHVWGVKDGLPYSSGRERYPDAAIIIDDDNAMVEASGTLHGAEPVDNAYTRKFRISTNGVEVSVAVDVAGFTELWESFPFYLGEDEATDGQIQFQVNGVWLDATTEPVEATAAQIERGGYAVQCAFGQTERVRLSDEVWTTTYQVKSRIRSVMIDVMQRGETRYTFSGAYRESLVKV